MKRLIQLRPLLTMILKAVEKDYQTNWKGTAAYACQQSNEIKTLGSGPEHFIFANLGRRNILHNTHKFISLWPFISTSTGLALLASLLLRIPHIMEKVSLPSLLSSFIKPG